MHHTYLTTERLEGFDLFGFHTAMADREKEYLMPLGELHYLMIGAEFVTFLKGPREARKDNEDFHI
jgi:hypothetical protein